MSLFSQSEVQSCGSPIQDFWCHVSKTTNSHLTNVHTDMVTKEFYVIMTTPGAKIAKTEIFFAGLTLPLLGGILDLVMKTFERSQGWEKRWDVEFLTWKRVWWLLVRTVIVSVIGDFQPSNLLAKVAVSEQKMLYSLLTISPHEWSWLSMFLFDYGWQSCVQG